MFTSGSQKMPEPLAGPVPIVAVDVGNSRVKWGLFIFGRLVHVASVPLSDPDAYDRQSALWTLSGLGVNWSGARGDDGGSKGICDWIDSRGFPTPYVLQDPRLLPLRVDLDRPEAVGIDRLLDAVAVNDRRPQDRPAVIVD